MEMGEKAKAAELLVLCVDRRSRYGVVPNKLSLSVVRSS